MANTHVINGAPINGSSGALPITLTVDIDLPALVADIELLLTDTTGINATLPALTAEIYGGGYLEAELPALTAAVSMTVQTTARVDQELPTLTAEIALSAEQYANIDAVLPALTGSMLGGGVVAATFPKLTGELAFTVEPLMRVDASLPSLTGSLELTADGTLRIDATLPALSTRYFHIDGSLPSLTADITLAVATTLDLIAYAVNLSHGAITPYSGFDFQHIVRFRGKTYGLDSTGGYEIAGDDDDGAPIDAFIELPESKFGASNEKNAPYVYIGAKGTDQFNVTAKVDDDTEVTVPTRSARRNKRAKHPRGLKSVYWGYKVANISGGSMDIDTIEILPELKRRKV